MTLILSSSRKKTEPMRVHLRRDRVILPGLDRRTLIRTHPARLAQRRRDYNRLVQGYERQRERGLDDLVGLTAPASPALRIRPVIEGVNYPAPGETWAELEAFRARYGLPSVSR